MEDRKINFDYLKILIMIMIVSLHLITHGDLLKNKSLNFFSNAFIQVIYVSCLPAINIFVLLSGFFLSEKNFSWKRLLRIVSETFFYSITIFFTINIFGEKYTTVEIIKSFFPIITGEYWFVTTYVALLVLSPFLNIWINNLEKKKFEKLLFSLFVLLSLWSNLVPIMEQLDNTGGKNIIWFMFLYLIGGYFKRYPFSIKPYSCLGLYFITVGILLFSKLLLTKLLILFFNSTKGATQLFNYNSFIVLFASVFLFVCFQNINFKSKSKNLSLISKATFSVYLIHDNPAIRNILYTNILFVQKFLNNIFFPIIFISFVILIFVACICIDIIRLNFFKFVKKLFCKVNIYRKEL